MNTTFHSRACRVARVRRRRSVARRDVVSPGARLVRVERVGRVEGGSIKPIATRPLVWHFSTFQPFNTSTSYYTHDMRPRRRRRVARRSVATEPRSGRKRPRNKNVSDLVVSSNLSVAAHYEYAPFGKTIVDTSGNEDASARGQSNSNPFRFSSEYFDESLALIYYTYRHYLPVDGRWNRRDLLQCVNLFLFLDNNNLGSIDDLGLVKYSFVKAKCLLNYV